MTLLCYYYLKIGIKVKKLTYKTMWGGKKEGVLLYPIDPNDYLSYRILDHLNYGSFEPYETVIFQKDPRGNIKSFQKGFNEYFKKPLYKSFKFKLYSRLTIISVLLIILVSGILFII